MNNFYTIYSIVYDDTQKKSITLDFSQLMFKLKDLTKICQTLLRI